MPRLTRETIGTGDQSWIGSTHSIYHCRTVPLDEALFEAINHPDGYLLAGIPLGMVTATKKYGIYTGDATDEVQTITEGGSGLTSFTLTYAGQTTASIDDDATAAEVQAALEALSNLAPGDVVVTGGPLGTGPFSVTFGGTLANTNVAQMTATPTGGTGTVTIATGTAGGADASSDGREVLAGFLYTDQKFGEDMNVPLLWHGLIKVRRLPVVFAATGHNTTGQFTFINEGVV